VSLPRRSCLPLLAGVIVLLGLPATGCGSTAQGGTGGGGPAAAVRVSLTDDDCRPTPATVPAGPVTFTIKNEGGSSVAEAELVQGSKILGEKEGLTPGLSGSFSLNLEPGSYQLYCPNAKTERTEFTVTGSAG
jgi:iron uptake system component EfeO